MVPEGDCIYVYWSNLEPELCCNISCTCLVHEMSKVSLVGASDYGELFHEMLSETVSVIVGIIYCLFTRLCQSLKEHHQKPTKIAAKMNPISKTDMTYVRYLTYVGHIFKGLLFKIHEIYETFQLKNFRPYSNWIHFHSLIPFVSSYMTIQD